MTKSCLLRLMRQSLAIVHQPHGGMLPLSQKRLTKRFLNSRHWREFSLTP